MYSTYICLAYHSFSYSYSQLTKTILGLLKGF